LVDLGATRKIDRRRVYKSISFGSRFGHDSGDVVTERTRAIVGVGRDGGTCGATEGRNSGRGAEVHRGIKRAFDNICAFGRIDVDDAIPTRFQLAIAGTTVSAKVTAVVALFGQRYALTISAFCIANTRIRHRRIVPGKRRIRRIFAIKTVFALTERRTAIVIFRVSVVASLPTTVDRLLSGRDGVGPPHDDRITADGFAFGRLIRASPSLFDFTVKTTIVRQIVHVIAFFFIHNQTITTIN